MVEGRRCWVHGRRNVNSKEKKKRNEGRRISNVQKSFFNIFYYKGNMANSYNCWVHQQYCWVHLATPLLHSCLKSYCLIGFVAWPTWATQDSYTSSILNFQKNYLSFFYKIFFNFRCINFLYISLTIFSSNIKKSN